MSDVIEVRWVIDLILADFILTGTISAVLTSFCRQNNENNHLLQSGLDDSSVSVICCDSSMQRLLVLCMWLPLICVPLVIFRKVRVRLCVLSGLHAAPMQLHRAARLEKWFPPQYNGDSVSECCFREGGLIPGAFCAAAPPLHGRSDQVL